MLICSFGRGMTSVAEANHSASSSGATSGSSRIAAAMSSSVSASTRAQSVRGRSATARNFIFEESFFTRVCLSRGDYAASLSSPRIHNYEDTPVHLASSDDAGLSIVATSVGFFDYLSNPDLTGRLKVGLVLLDVEGFLLWIHSKSAIRPSF